MLANNAVKELLSYQLCGAVAFLTRNLRELNDITKTIIDVEYNIVQYSTVFYFELINYHYFQIISEL